MPKWGLRRYDAESWMKLMKFYPTKGTAGYLVTRTGTGRFLRFGEESVTLKLLLSRTGPSQEISK